MVYNNFIDLLLYKVARIDIAHAAQGSDASSRMRRRGRTLLVAWLCSESMLGALPENTADRICSSPLELSVPKRA